MRPRQRNAHFLQPVLYLCALFLCFATSVHSETLRIATYNTELSRKAPGILLRDIEKGDDPQIQAVLKLILKANADVLLLQGIDWDYELRALKALERRLALSGQPYPHLFMAQPNRGRITGLDLDGDGRLNGSGDAQGFGRFSGQNGMALLSRRPLIQEEIEDYSTLLWRDLPGARLPQHPDGSPFPSAQAQSVQRLSSTAHWRIPLRLENGGRLDLLCFQAGTPLFDGREDRNGLRNRDEIRFWTLFLDGAFSSTWRPPPKTDFVLLGDANLDPDRGAGHRDAIANLLQDRRLKDPFSARSQDEIHTVDWGNAGKMRTSYVLPSSDLTTPEAGIISPVSAFAASTQAGRHRLVWVDIDLN